MTSATKSIVLLGIATFTGLFIAIYSCLQAEVAPAEAKSTIFQGPSL